MKEAQEEEIRASSHKQIHRRTFRVTKSYYADRTVSELVQMHLTKANISRLQREGVVTAFLPAVGTHDELAKLRPVGDLCDETLNLIEGGGSKIIFRDLLVLRKDVFGKRPDTVHAWEDVHAMVTRIRRDNSEFLPSPGFILEPADVVRAVGTPESVEAFALAPALGFASVYPISMIGTIATAQILVLLLHAIK